MKKICLALIVLAMVSCKKDDPGPEYIEENPGFTIEGKTGFLISNEGQFQSINASISFYDAESGEIYNGIYGSRNELVLGDVMNDMTEELGTYYFVINNSGKIVYTDSKLDFKGEITGLTSPRRMTKVNPTTAFVTDLFSNQISIVDLSDKEVTGSLTSGGWTEHIFVTDDKIFVSDHTNNKVVSYNQDTFNLEGQIEFNETFTGLCQKENGDVVVLNQDSDGNNFAVVIDGEDAIITDTLELGNSFNWATYPTIYTNDFSEDVLFYSLDGIQKINLVGDQNPVEFLSASSISVYGLDIYDDQLIISDAGDFTTNGSIHFYGLDGGFIKEMEVGVAPNGVLGF